MLKRILPIFLFIVCFTSPVYGQGPPPDVMSADIAQQEQAGLALEKEMADPNKIGNLSQGSLVENFKKGGVIMYFILACSIIGVYVTIERSFSLQRSRVLPRKFINNVLSIISTAPPRIPGQSSPYPSYPPGGQSGYQPAPQASQAPQASSESAPPYQTPPLQTPQPTQPTAPPQPAGEDQGETVAPEPQQPPAPAPGPDSGQVPPPPPQPAEEEQDYQKDMDSLLNILNKGLGGSDAGSEGPDNQAPDSGVAETPPEGPDEPDKGPGSEGSGSPPMNMSYPAGASYNTPYPGYNFAAEDTMPPSGGYAGQGGGGYYGAPPAYEGGDVVDQILDYCEGKNIPLARVLKGGLLVYGEGILSIKSAITNANLHEGAIMEKGVGILGVLANVAPLLGLLGTVTGMIKAFEMISIGGTGRPEIVAIGIAEALTTTAGGLFVGIPLLLLFHWLQGKIENMMIDLQEFSVDVVEKIFREGK